MSLSYLSSPHDRRLHMEESLIRNGDTHIYVYSRSEGDGPRVFPQSDWEEKLDHLNRRGLKPVMWLMADDSPSLVALSMEQHYAHNKEMVRRFDSKVDAYVIGLEVDEYWSVAQVNSLISELRKHTTKPIGVHLTPSTPIQYVENADVLYLQTGFGLSQEQFKEKVKATLSVSSKPVIVSEYHMNSASAEAKQLGDIACSLGAIGTGNGRNIQSCKKEVIPEFGGSAALVIGAVAALIGLNVYMKNNYSAIGYIPEEGAGFNYTTDGKAILTYRIIW